MPIHTVETRVDRWIRFGRAVRALPFALVVLVGLPSLAGAQSVPAARRLDPTNHGGAILQGSPTGSIAGQPAARLGDAVSCPLSCPGGSAHVGGPIVNGSATVRINGQPAARAGSVVSETCATSTIANGASTVRIGP